MKVFKKVDKPTLIIGVFWCVIITGSAFFNARSSLTVWDVIILVVFTSVVGLAFFLKAKLKFEEGE